MRARLLSLFLANQAFKIINRPIAGAHPAGPAILTYSPASPTVTDVSLSYNVASTVAQAAYPLSVEFYKSGIGNNPAQFIGRDTLLAAEAGSNKSVVFTVPAGIVLDSESVILASASASDHRGSSEFSRYISLLSFVGNAPAYAGQTSTIRVRMQATGPFRPQGKVTISDDYLLEPWRSAMWQRLRRPQVRLWRKPNAIWRSAATLAIPRFCTPNMSRISTIFATRMMVSPRRRETSAFWRR